MSQYRPDNKIINNTEQFMQNRETPRKLNNLLREDPKGAVNINYVRY